jgi:hypothetical protein
VDERCCYISSAANIRRREMHGQGRYYQEEEPATLRRKKRFVKKKAHKKVDLAGLKEMQKKVKDLTSIDDRGLKKKNPKRAVASVEKWETSNMWREIVDEGIEKSKHAVEAIRMLHVPDTTPVGRKDPEPPPGFRRVKFEPKTGGSIFHKLLSISTQLFEKIQDKGKNLSSMTTEITILGEADEVNVRKAAINGIKVRSVNNRMLIQKHTA